MREGEASEAIRRVARQRLCSLREIGKDFWYEDIPPVPPLSRPTAGHVAVRTWCRDWGELTVPLLGSHQAQNVAVVLASLDLLAETAPSLEVKRDDVVRGFASLKWPARVEVIGKNPWLVVDGAHNVASAVALADTLRSCFPPTRRTLVFGTTRDKDLVGQLQALLPCFDTVIVTRYVENPRSVPPETIADQVVAMTGRPVRIAPEPSQALTLARELTDLDGLICVTGSLFLAAEARMIILGLPHPSSLSRAAT